MKINLTYVKNKEIQYSKKENPKTGSPYEYFFCSIRCKELKDSEGKEVWINGFGNDTTKSWEDSLMAMDRDNRGLSADVHIYDEDYEGKTYKKFKFLSEKDKMALELEEMKKKLAKAEEKPKATGVVEMAKEVFEQERVNAEDLPF